MSDVGGTAGLLLGISAITFIELMELAMDTLVILFRKMAFFSQTRVDTQ